MNPTTLFPTGTFWNGEPCTARRVLVKVGKALKPTWWCAELEGTVRRAVEITSWSGKPFFLDDEEKQSGWRKVTVGMGSPQFGHSSLPDDSEVIRELSAEEIAVLNGELVAMATD